ncbi:MAG: hypothetical protein JWO19_416 [Bryobacterales bacterium]|nr:hypothetical protein [Bryobacterales bacterium]
MRIARLAICFVVGVLSAIAQTDRATITGTISDPTGAVVANAAIEAKNVATAQVYPGTSTATGNFTIVNLPPGSYELTANIQGFKKYTRQGLTLAPTQTVRIDIGLEVGSNAETVTVTAEATLLKTENGELATNVTGERLNNLPLLGIGPQGASAAGIRNPWALAQLVPGAQFNIPNSGVSAGTQQLTVNGAPTNTASFRVEGMDAGTNGTLVQYPFEVQPSAEAIQEVAVQTSNFAAEYGTVGGGLLNATMRSGTNQYHGSLYDYNVNEAFNASQPYTGLHNKARRNDYGGSLGGPVRIPKVYNGTDKTFFFWNFEQFRENQSVLTQAVTVPIQDYRNGDFSRLFGFNNNQLLRVGSGASATNYVDPLGRTVLSGTIYDPNSFQTVVVNNQNLTVRNPFPDNKIPLARQDQVALNIQKLIPLPRGPNALTQVGSNFNGLQNSHRTTEIPSLKIDQSIGSKGHLSFFWSRTVTADQYPIVGSPATPEGFPSPITTAIGNFDNAHNERLNYDHSLTPTLLLHLGIGFQRNFLRDNAPDVHYDVLKELGLKGATAVRNFPTLTITGVPTVATGGMSNMGPLFQLDQHLEKPAANLGLTWVRNNHTWKLGGEWRAEGNPQVSNVQPPWNNSGSIGFGAPVGGAIPTAQTALEPVVLSQGSTGFAYASFLLGQVSSYGLGVPAVYKFGKQQWALFLQDTWKVTRKLTLDYGLRWDYGTYPRETYGRIADFSRTIANPSAGGHPGGVIYEAFCSCRFASNYPYALGPRIGIAYQINSKTVLRGGFGVVYNVTNVPASTPLNYQTLGTPGFGLSFFNLQDGPPSTIKPVFPNFSAGALPLNNTTGGPPAYIDPNASRPARQYQWSIGIQRELTRNLVVEASYVANRGIWWSTGGAGALAPVNSMSEALLNKYGFNVGNLADRTLLQTQVRQIGTADRSALAARGIVLPYSGFDTAQTLLQSLLPFPQYTGNISPVSAPLGKTWYDSLQATVTERFSHGLTVNGNFTWSKNLDLFSSPDIFNRGLGKNLSANDLPFQLRLSAQYTTPRTNFFQSKVISYVLGDWNIGWYMQYQSAPIITRPTANAGAAPINGWLGRGPGPAELVAGQPLYTTNWVDLDGKQHTDELDINCHCFDPTKTVVLNPAAWAGVPDGKWSSNFSSIREFRGIRLPTENANFGRTFRIKEKMTFNVRVEFSNIFNRLRLPQPTSTGTGVSPTSPALKSPLTGLYSSGYGTIVPTAGTQGYRTGTLVGRITF